MTKGIIYYTCNTHLPIIDELCRHQLLKAKLPIVSVSLNKELDFGTVPLILHGTRGPLMMHKQILAGLQSIDVDTVFLCESDVLYHPSHFHFTPEDDNAFYYNTNVWKQTWPNKHFIWTDDLRQVSGVCAHRKTLLEFYTKRVAQIEEEGFNRHYEPGIKQTVGSQKVIDRLSDYPNICIRHKNNLTKTKVSPAEFRNPIYAKGWREQTSVPGWNM